MYFTGTEMEPPAQMPAKSSSTLSGTSYASQIMKLFFTVNILHRYCIWVCTGLNTYTRYIIYVNVFIKCISSFAWIYEKRLW